MAGYKQVTQVRRRQLDAIDRSFWVTWRGKRHTIRQWAKILWMPAGVLRLRLFTWRMPIEKAFTLPYHWDKPRDPRTIRLPRVPKLIRPRLLFACRCCGFVWRSARRRYMWCPGCLSRRWRTGRVPRPAGHRSICIHCRRSSVQRLATCCRYCGLPDWVETKRFCRLPDYGE